MKYTLGQIIGIIRNSNLKNPDDEEDFGYCHALADLEVTFREIDQGLRDIHGNWKDVKSSPLQKRKV